ncbi:hypothetical protein FHT40_000233 [Mycolicibacterium sp. BK556]|uniref:hypothetical protein n=1 Tax=Mycobacteriaceae TaxID=1762 RepID=UPI00105CAB6D|nr:MULTISPECIES: hypothetical protein [Mycobacteriaceae]MBB3600600.1 hypothetical protein [Mycolicibacterium sp. BK556]MBB3630353.1 hypothetical protein [Mycolicibacterium sp. BK607]MBB3748352.1 hypothetical protein [Mycolicibacterium sp. BK634]TDO10142.1 hypothetical protein EV580_4427 [Mycobacterium sp. BK086]
MTTTNLAIAEPPWTMTTPATPQLVITVILGIVVAAFVIAALIEWRRSGRPIFLLMLVGGYVCSFNEATVDVLGHCYFPGDGAIAYRFLDRSVPVWVVLAYVVFFGGLSYVMAKAFQKGASRSQMWSGIAVFGVLNVLLEIPMLSSGLYVYYGDQPFTVAGFPISWLVINSLGSLFGAVVVTRLDWLFTGVRQLFVAFIPFTTYMASWALAIPYFAITNTDAPGSVRMIAAAVSIVLGLLATDVLIRFGTGEMRLIPPPQNATTNPEMVQSR